MSNEITSKPTQRGYDGMTPQELVDTQAWLSIEMLRRIWNLKGRMQTIRRLTGKNSPFRFKAFKNADQWFIQASDFTRITQDIIAGRL